MRSFIAALRPAALLVSLAMFAPVHAADDQDPPGRVARLSLAEGAVSLQPSGTQDWANADINRPLTTGDKLWTDENSRAELDIGSAAIRLGSSTGFSFLNLDDQATQMQVTAGTLIVRVRSLDEGQSFEVDTPNLAVSLMQPGQYRVQVNDAGDTTVVEVSEGQAQVAAGDKGFPVYAQQKATFAGTQNLSSVVATLGAPDEFDTWSLSRDRQMRDSQSQQYVSPDATGVADLDNNGRWDNTPDYGYVWTPTTVAVGWAPYRFGHWVWVGPWGWTWVDDAPWGFAPFHYGRWAYLRNSWCWVPGPRQVRAVYAPALVAWVGGPGGGVSVSAGAGVGWFPLGPREVFVPSYRVSPGYVERVNISNTRIVDRTYITNVYQNRVTNITYVNRGVEGAVTSVPRNVFTSAQPVGRNRIHVPEGDLRNFTARGAAPAIAPGRESFVGAGARTNVRQPPPTLINRPVVVRTPPPRSTGVFNRPSEVIRSNGGPPGNRPPLGLPQRGPQDSNMADRERALRDNRVGGAQDNRPGGTAESRPGEAPDNRSGGVPDSRSGGAPDNRPSGAPDGRPPVQARQGLRIDRPPGNGNGNSDRAPQQQQAQPPQQQQPERPPPQSQPQSPQPRGPGNQFDRPQVDRSPPERFQGNPSFGRPQADRPQVDRPQARAPQISAPPPAPTPPPAAAPRIEERQVQPPPRPAVASPPPPPPPAQRAEPKSRSERPERSKTLDDHR